MLSGVKYLLRSDIMFRRTDVPLISDDETRAFALIEDAKQLESSGIRERTISLLGFC